MIRGAVTGTASSLVTIRYRLRKVTARPSSTSPVEKATHTQLEQLAQWTVIVEDTGDIEAIRAHQVPTPVPCLLAACGFDQAARRDPLNITLYVHYMNTVFACMRACHVSPLAYRHTYMFVIFVQYRITP